jgi:hypothetical protein
VANRKKPKTRTQAQRRRRSAVAALRKDTTLRQTDHGPRAEWGAKKPNVKKK